MEEHCLACNSVLETRETQMRSADEAQTAITSCPKCPIDANKISISGTPTKSLRGMVRHTRKYTVPGPRASISSRKIYTLLYDIPDSSEFTNTELSQLYLIQYVPIISPAKSLEVKSFQVVEGIFKGRCISEKTSETIAPGVSLQTYEAIGDLIELGTQVIIRGRYVYFRNILGNRSYITNFYHDSRKTLVVNIGTLCPSLETLKQVTYEVYSLGIFPQKISYYIDANFVSTVNSRAPKAWDTNVPPESGHKFTCKPDGQRSRLIWIDHMWYECDASFKKRPRGWIWSNIKNTNSPVVVDAESMASYGFIVIDCLTDVKGSLAPENRDVNWIMSVSSDICRATDGMTLIVRKYFDAYEDARRYCSKVSYPIDGIIAIRNGSTEILKIKSVKSMELRFENGTFMTVNNRKILECPSSALSRFVNDDIIEIRFNVTNRATISVLEMFKREDKTLANDDEAVANIIQSANIRDMPTDNERRAALIWCNKLRRDVHNSALATKSTRTIIMDVGTGEGQSLGNIEVSGVHSYILVEPSAERCKLLARRLRIKHVYCNAADILPLLKSLKTRSISYVIMNLPLKQMIDNDRVAKALSSEVYYVSATFSMHFIIDELEILRHDLRLPVYGCAYIYDAINKDGILIDTCGVLMKTENEREASVKWGRDEPYLEPLVRKRDFSGLGSILYASEFMQLPDAQVSPNAREICSHIVVLTP